ncbi:uncharacterized protein [Oscarella lobularis]|uniref:uncharacterized protein n=1 Tax=Oscarella lobularis TaxID=121494 RepID=UPI0033144483
MATSAWRRITEPQSKKTMYVNTKTGECAWNEPDGERATESQATDWWELVDPGSSRHYYYNQASGKKRWKRPRKGDIVFMAKVQDPSSTAVPEAAREPRKPKADAPPPAKPKPFAKPPVAPPPAKPAIIQEEEEEKEKEIPNTTTTDPDVPIWLEDSIYDLCLVQADESAFADELAAYFDQFAVRYLRHKPSSLDALRRRYDDYNDEDDPDPGRSRLEIDLRGSKFFMFVFGRYFVDASSEYEDRGGDGLAMSHFPPEDPIHSAMELVNLLPILDGTTQDDLKGYSTLIGSKIPIKSSIGSKRLAEMFFKKLTGQMPNENFKLMKYLEKKKKR